MKKTILSIICILLSIALNARKTGISGTVRDENGDPVPGAVVIAISSQRSTTGSQQQSNPQATSTDAAGRFSLNIDDNCEIISVQCLGFVTQTVKLYPSRLEYEITLKSDNIALESIVVVGYGSVRSSDITGSITQVKVDEMESTRAISAEQMLLGRAAGVQVTTTSGAPGAGMNIRIRGNSSFNGGGEPLYVVDGIILNSDNSNIDVMSRATGMEEEETSGLLGINPQDISSMEILKDASATAIYGALGANGVVLITTKSAKKEKPVISFSTGFDIARRSNSIDVMDLDTFVSYADANGFTGLNNRIWKDPSDRSQGYKVKPVFWQDRLMRTAVNQRYYFSIANKRKGTGYLMSLGYKSNQGILKNSNLDQLNARLNLDRSISDKLQLALKFNISRVNSSIMQGTSSASMTSATSAIRSMINALPFESDDEEDDDPMEEDNDDMGSRADRWLNDYSNKRSETRIIPNLSLSYKPLDWLTAKLVAGSDYRVKSSSKWKGPFVTSNTDWALAGKGTVEQLNFNFDALLLFDKSRGQHNISGTAGVTYFNSSSRSDVREGWNIPQYNGQDKNINSAPITSTRFSYYEQAASTLSFLARVIYSYKGRYIVTATFRRDGSSRFAREFRFANFPSLALAWRVNEEPWFPTDAISNLKLRLGWGRVGNQAISSYQTLSNYESIFYPDHSTGNENKVIVGLAPSNLANKGLKWETTEQSNAGLDFGLNRNRLKLSFDCYSKNTFDLLQSLTVPATTGYTTMWTNIGTIHNEGIELSIETVPLRTSNAEWSLFGNISRNRNKIVSIGIPSSDELAPYFLGAEIGNANYCKSAVNIFMEGQPMGLFYGLETDGIIPIGETGPGLTRDNPLGPGSIKYIDHNEDGVIDLEDRQIIGDPNPDFTYGFGSSFKWKSLMLDIQFEGSYGNDIANLNLIQEWDSSRRRSNIRTEAFTDAWSEDNPGGRFPKLGSYSYEENKFFTDRHVIDGSYLRLSSVSLCWTVPIPAKKAIKGLDITLGGQNLLCITRYNGWDPNVNVYGGNMMKMGVDFASYPKARTFSLDVKMRF
ncbi:MAG: TonB-dependent receptor [Bacteroidales bacterium]|nr:TonB-dependent receptor [Bacteroidales bacterium]